MTTLELRDRVAVWARGALNRLSSYFLQSFPAFIIFCEKGLFVGCRDPEKQVVYFTDKFQNTNTLIREDKLRSLKNKEILFDLFRSSSENLWFQYKTIINSKDVFWVRKQEILDVLNKAIQFCSYDLDDYYSGKIGISIGRNLLKIFVPGGCYRYYGAVENIKPETSCSNLNIIITLMQARFLKDSISRAPDEFRITCQLNTIVLITNERLIYCYGQKAPSDVVTPVYDGILLSIAHFDSQIFSDIKDDEILRIEASPEKMVLSVMSRNKTRRSWLASDGWSLGYFRLVVPAHMILDFLTSGKDQVVQLRFFDNGIEIKSNMETFLIPYILI